jgi:hypothetical protein
MKKVNLLKEIIILNEQELLNAINSQKEFGITYDSKITFNPQDEIVIFQGKYTPKDLAITPSKPFDISKFLGDDYKIAKQDGNIGIKASMAWQKIVKINYDKALYDDTTTDGVAEFSDDNLEDIGWWADEFDITYRELIDILENECDGVLLCVEQEGENYRFSGLGFIDDAKQAYDILYKWCQNKIKEIIKTDSFYAPDKLSDDEKKALEYFNIQN